MIKKIRLLSISFILIVSFTSIFVFNTRYNINSSKCSPNIVAGGNSTIGGNFSLIDTSGKLRNNTEIIVKPTLIYFGYSYCPDVCPFDLQRNAIAVDILDDRKIDVIPIFITIDPERDTPKRMRDFTSFVHPKMIGLTGSREQISKAMKQFKVYGQKASGISTEGDYLMDHSSFTYLVDPELGFLDYFNRSVSPVEMADIVECFLSQT